MVPSKIIIVTLVLAVKAMRLASAEELYIDDSELPNRYEELDYNITMHLNHDLFTENGTQYSGIVEIVVKFNNETDYIPLHMDRESMVLNKITFEGFLLPTSLYSINPKNGMLIIYAGQGITADTKYHLKIEYIGTITTTSLSGFYKSSYVNRNREKKYLLTTLFALSPTRKVFPCFDEPYFKSHFNFTFVFPTGLDVLFNTNEMKRTFNRSSRLTTVRFQQTPKMSTRSVAFVISDLTCTALIAGRVPMRVCSRNETASQRDLALDVIPRALEQLNYFTNFEYSRRIRKLDVVAVPDFPAAAAENWGLQIHRETELLFDNVESPSYSKRYITAVLTHELAHHWFGNIITSKLSSDVFLTEGMTTYLEYYIVNKFKWYKYLRILQGIIIPAFKLAVEDSNKIWLHHGRPTRNSAMEIQFLVSNVLWPAKSPDLTLVYYFLWGHTRKEVYSFDLPENIQILEHIRPDYQMDKRLIIERLHPMLLDDAVDGVRPLLLENSTSTDYEYSDVPYNKGSSILRMVQHFMSPDKFRTGVRNFIRKYQYEDADIEDFWNELNNTIDDTISKMPANLSTVMWNWTRKTGFPLVTARLNGNTITFTQSKFSYSGLAKRTKWYIPISFTDSCHTTKFQSTTPDFWLTPNVVMHTNLPSDCDWIILNNQQTGYYRVNYNTALWTKIKAALLKENFDGIVNLNRAQIVDDIFNLARVDKLSYSFVLDTLRFLKEDTSYYTWKAALDGLEIILRRVGEDTVLGKVITKDILDLIDNFYNSVPITDLKQDDEFYSSKQLLAASWACRLGHQECITEALSLFKLYKVSNKRPTPNLRDLVYCNGLRYSQDYNDWRFMWQAYLNANEEPSEQQIIRYALGCSRNQTLLKEYLQMTITKDSAIRSQDAYLVFLAVGSKPHGIDVAFDFLMENQEYVLEHYQSLGIIEFLFTGMADRIKSEAQIKKLINLVTSGKLKKGFKEHGQKAKFAAELTRKWLEKYSKDVKAYYFPIKDDSSPNLYYLFSLLLVIPVAGFVYWMYRKKKTAEPVNEIQLQVG